MFRNVPRKMTPSALLFELDRVVERSCINLLYLPWEISGKANLGCAFVNFTTTEAAARVWREMDGRRWTVLTSNKGMLIVPAQAQGLRANLLHSQHRLGLAGDATEFDPLVFECGQQVDYRSLLGRLLHDSAADLEQRPSQCLGVVSGASANSVGPSSSLGRAMSGAAPTLATTLNEDRSSGFAARVSACRLEDFFDIVLPRR